MIGKKLHGQATIQHKTLTFWKNKRFWTMRKEKINETLAQLCFSYRYHKIQTTNQYYHRFKIDSKTCHRDGNRIKTQAQNRFNNILYERKSTYNTGSKLIEKHITGTKIRNQLTWRLGSTTSFQVSTLISKIVSS